MQIDESQPSIQKISINKEDLPSKPSEKEKQELDQFERKERETRLSEEIADKQSYRRLREKYANLAFKFLSIWAFLVFLILFFAGFSCRGFHLPDATLSVLVGSTTVSAIGLVITIARGLFRSSD